MNGRNGLVAVSGGLDEGPQRFVRESAADLKAALEAAIGALVEAEVEKLAVEYCGGVEHMKPAERRFWRSEAYTAWVKKLYRVTGDREVFERLRAIGRGEEVEDR